MGWFNTTWEWIANHPHKGGGHFVEFCIGINAAQIGWERFKKKIQYAERRYQSKRASYLLTLCDLDGGDQIAALVQLNRSMSWVAWMVTPWTWKIIYLLSVFAVATGAFMLWLEAHCGWSVLLLTPSALYLILSFIPLGWLKWQAIPTATKFAKQMANHRDRLKAGRLDAELFSQLAKDDPPISESDDHDDHGGGIGHLH